MTQEGKQMDRERFEYLLAAYGADFMRWPSDEREAGAAYARAHGADVAALLAGERALDEALASLDEAPDTELLARRILKAAPRRGGVDMRAALALAACATFGVILGYGAGHLAPVADEDDTFFATAFEAPFADGDEG
jgi:hypothetical protein